MRFFCLLLLLNVHACRLFANWATVLNCLTPCWCMLCFMHATGEVTRMIIARKLLQYLNWMMRANRTGKLILCWIMKNSRKAAHVSSIYLLRFTGYGPEEDRWTEDVSQCKRLVQEYWDKKPVAERLVAAVCVAF